MKLRWEVGAGLAGAAFIFLLSLGFQLTATKAKPVSAIVLSMLAGGASGLLLTAAAMVSNGFRETDNQPVPLAPLPRPLPIGEPLPEQAAQDDDTPVAFPVELIKALGGSPDEQLQTLVTYIMSAHPTDPTQAARLIEAATQYSQQLKQAASAPSVSDLSTENLWEEQSQPPAPALDFDIPPPTPAPEPAPAAVEWRTARRSEFGGIELI